MATEALAACAQLINLLLAHRKSLAISICELIDAMQTLHALDVARQALLLRGNRQTTGVAKAVVPTFQLMIQRNTLIEHETLPVPTAVLL